MARKKKGRISSSFDGFQAEKGILESPEFAATLLILREFMHHMRFASITVQA